MKSAVWSVGLALCALSASTPALAAPTVTITTVYAFKGGTDGSGPSDTLTFYNGALYGTTGGGGTTGNGTIFAIDAQTGNESIIYSFQSGGDGSWPQDSTLNFLNGIIYGTTQFGGEAGLGTIFSFNPATGAETVLYSFKGGADGALPSSGLFYKDGVFYGATVAGGNGDCGFDFYSGCGTLYKFDISSGAESVLHAFEFGQDTSAPYGSLILFNGVLFGATVGDNCRCGGIYSLDPKSGKYSVLYSFGGPTPSDALTKVGKYLYGSTQDGGRKDNGAVFQFDPATNFVKKMWSIASEPIEGRAPNGPLLFKNGTLYGTTSGGSGAGIFGTLYSFNPPNHNKSLLATFGGPLGTTPQGGLTYDGTSFWGTTLYGGGPTNSGTVFKFTVQP